MAQVTPDYDAYFANVPTAVSESQGSTPSAASQTPSAPASVDYDKYFGSIPSVDGGSTSSASDKSSAGNTVVPNPWWYTAGKALTGLMTGEGGPAYLPGVMADPSLYNAPTPTEGDANKLVFGAPNVTAPGPVSRFAGGIASSVAEDPANTLLFPGTTLAGSAGGQAGALTGIPGASAVGGLLGGLASGAGEAALASRGAAHAIEDIANKLGSADTYQSAGQHLISGAKDWVQNKIPALEDAVWNPFHSMMAAGGKTPNPNAAMLSDFGIGRANTDTPVDSYLSALEGLSNEAKLGPLAGQGKQIQSPIVDRLVSDARKSGLLAEGGEAPEGGETEIPPVPSFSNVKAFRSQIGDALANPKNPLYSLPNTQKSALYSALTEDLRATASKNGLLDEFDRANQVSSDLRTHASQYLQPLVHDNVAPEAAAQAALKNTGAKGGGTNLAALRAVMPEAVDQLASSVLRTAPTDFAKMAPEAQAALIPDGGMRQTVLDAISKRMTVPKAGAGQATASGLGGAAAGLVGNALLNHLGQGTTPELASGIGALAGEAAPYVKGTAKYLARNPQVLVKGVLGAEAGQNAQNGLFPSP